MADAAEGEEQASVPCAWNVRPPAGWDAAVAKAKKLVKKIAYDDVEAMENLVSQRCFSAASDVEPSDDHGGDDHGGDDDADEQNDHIGDGNADGGDEQDDRTGDVNADEEDVQNDHTGDDNANEEDVQNDRTGDGNADEESEMLLAVALLSVFCRRVRDSQRRERALKRNSYFDSDDESDLDGNGFPARSTGVTLVALWQQALFAYAPIFLDQSEDFVLFALSRMGDSIAPRPAYAGEEPWRYEEEHPAIWDEFLEKFEHKNFRAPLGFGRVHDLFNAVITWAFRALQKAGPRGSVVDAVEDGAMAEDVVEEDPERTVERVICLSMRLRLLHNREKGRPSERAKDVDAGAAACEELVRLYHFGSRNFPRGRGGDLPKDHLVRGLRYALPVWLDDKITDGKKGERRVMCAATECYFSEKLKSVELPLIRHRRGNDHGRGYGRLELQKRVERTGTAGRSSEWEKLLLDTDNGCLVTPHLVKDDGANLLPRGRRDKLSWDGRGDEYRLAGLYERDGSYIQQILGREELGFGKRTPEERFYPQLRNVKQALQERLQLTAEEPIKNARRFHASPFFLGFSQPAALDAELCLRAGTAVFGGRDKLFRWWPTYAAIVEHAVEEQMLLDSETGDAKARKLLEQCVADLTACVEFLRDDRSSDEEACGAEVEEEDAGTDEDSIDTLVRLAVTSFLPLSRIFASHPELAPVKLLQELLLVLRTSYHCLDNSIVYGGVECWSKDEWVPDLLHFARSTVGRPLARHIFDWLLLSPAGAEAESTSPKAKRCRTFSSPSLPISPAGPDNARSSSALEDGPLSKNSLLEVLACENSNTGADHFSLLPPPGGEPFVYDVYGGEVFEWIMELIPRTDLSEKHLDAMGLRILERMDDDPCQCAEHGTPEPWCKLLASFVQYAGGSAAVLGRGLVGTADSTSGADTTGAAQTAWLSEFRAQLKASEIRIMEFSNDCELYQDFKNLLVCIDLFSPITQWHVLEQAAMCLTFDPDCGKLERKSFADFSRKNADDPRDQEEYARFWQRVERVEASEHDRVELRERISIQLAKLVLMSSSSTSSTALTDVVVLATNARWISVHFRDMQELAVFVAAFVGEEPPDDGAFCLAEARKRAGRVLPSLKQSTSSEGPPGTYGRRGNQFLPIVPQKTQITTHLLVVTYILDVVVRYILWSLLGTIFCLRSVVCWCTKFGYW